MISFKKYLNTDKLSINENLAKNTRILKNYRANNSTSLKQNINVKIVEKLNVDDNKLKLKSFKKQHATSTAATTSNENNQPAAASENKQPLVENKQPSAATSVDTATSSENNQPATPSENNKPAAATAATSAATQVEPAAATASSELKSFKKQPSADTAAATAATAPSELKSFKKQPSADTAAATSADTTPEIILKDFKTYVKRGHVHSKDEIKIIVTDLTSSIVTNKNDLKKQKNQAKTDNVLLNKRIDFIAENYYTKTEMREVVDRINLKIDDNKKTEAELDSSIINALEAIGIGEFNPLECSEIGQDGSTLKVGGDLEVNNNVTLNGGGSLLVDNASPPTAAIIIDGSGHVTKIGQSTPSNGLVLSWDGTNNRAIWDAAAGGGSGDVSASSNFGSDNLLIRSDGTSKGVQATGITVSDNNDVSIFDDNNAADVTLKIGTSSDECLEIITKNGAANKTAEKIQFISKTNSVNANDGQFVFKVDEVEMFKIFDDRLFTTELMEAQSGVITNKLSINADNTAGINTADKSASITLGDEAKAGFYVQSDDHLYIENANQDKDIVFKANVGSTATTIATVDGTNGLFNLPASKLAIGGTAVTATAAELNILDASATTAGTTAVADGHGIVMQQGGATTLTTVETLAAYLDDEITAMPNLVTTAATTVGALATGSIASGFGTIATANTITTSAAITGGSLVLGTGVVSSISHTADADDEDFTISHLGNHDASLILSSAGTAADALQITTTAGGIDITNGGAAGGEDLDITSTNASLRLSAGEAVADAIVINASNAAGGIDIVSGTSGLDVDTTGEVNIASSKNGASAVVLTASSGGVDITATGAGAGEDINITATGSSVNITSTEGVDDAIVIKASNGGIDIESDGVMDIKTTDGGSNINITPNSSGSVVIGTNLSVTNGSIVLGSGIGDGTIGNAAITGTDTAGRNLTINAGQGTGTGAGGDIIFQVADGAGSSGSTPNLLETALTISDDKSATFTGDVTIGSSSTIKITDEGVEGIHFEVPDNASQALRFKQSGSTNVYFNINSSNTGTVHVGFPKLVKLNGGVEVAASTNITLGSATNFVLDNAGSGTQIGTNTDQKLGFFGASPVAQRPNIADASSTQAEASGAPTQAEFNGLRTDVQNLTTKLNDILTALESLGLLASS